MPVYRWSQIAGSNAGADPTIDWSEGQAPSSINNSARAEMAAIAQWRDDISGGIVTGGTSAAYTVTTFSNFTSAALLDKQIVAFTPHITNAVGPVTMTVDSIANIPLRSAPNTELVEGTLIAGTPYTAIYSNTDGALYLQGYYGNAFNIPLGGLIDFIGTSTPNSRFVFPVGQAISRTTYAALFAMTGTTYGAGNGTTTFNVPDLQGRVTAMKEAVATRLTNTGTGNVGIDGATMGATGGGSQTLLTANLPAYTPAGSVASTVNAGSQSQNGNPATAKRAVVNLMTGPLQYGGTGTGADIGNADISVSSTFTGTAQGGNSTPVKIAQPTIIVQKILRII